MYTLGRWLLKGLEITMVALMGSAVYLVYGFSQVVKVLTLIFQVALCVCAGGFAMIGINRLEPSLQTIVINVLLYGLSATFISAIALFFWKRERFSRIFQRISR